MTLPHRKNQLFDTEYCSPKSKLHVIYSASSPATNRWLAKYTIFPDDHLINQAFLQAKMLEDESTIPFPSWKESCTCEALPYKNRVYALFHLSPPPDPNQMTFFLAELTYAHTRIQRKTPYLHPSPHRSLPDHLKLTNPALATQPAKTII